MNISSSTNSDGKNGDEREVKAVIEGWAEATRQKDVHSLISRFTPEPLRFSLAPPLASQTSSTKEAEEWFGSFDGPIGYEVKNLSVTTGDHAAFAHGFVHITGTKKDGEKPNLWCRVTLGLQKIDGRWLISHLHESVPFLMDGSFKAAVDLTP